MNSFKDLIVWQKSFQLTKDVYEATGRFPKHEIYGLSSQLRRAAISITSNIAEGFSRKSERENAQFISIAFGSSSEVETQLLLAKEFNYLGDKEFEKLSAILIEVRKMLNSMLSKLKSKLYP